MQGLPNEKMKALRFHGAKDLRLDTVPVPPVQDEFVKVRVLAALARAAC
jgi:hypothetical protein